jgi:hypothetical protein
MADMIVDSTAYRRVDGAQRNPPRKAFHREGRQGREGKQSTSLVIKITNLVIASGFTVALISLASFASLAVQMLELG